MDPNNYPTFQLPPLPQFQSDSPRSISGHNLTGQNSRDDSPDSRGRSVGTSRNSSSNRNPSKSRSKSRPSGDSPMMGLPISLPYSSIERGSTERGRTAHRRIEETEISSSKSQERSLSTARAASRAREAKEQAREQKVQKAREKEKIAQEALSIKKEKESADPSKTKRIKVGARASIACKTCRRRKVRCSGEYPICRFCSARELPCEYEGHPAEHSGNMGTSNTFGFVFPPATPFAPVLPPVELILSGLDVFLVHYYDTFCFLHSPSLIHSIKNGTAPEELLFSILALAARFSQPLQDLHPWSITAASEHFYGNAKFLLNPPTTNPLQTTNSESFSLLRCQCLLIIGLYECTSGLENSGWFNVGKAIRICQILRLGLEDDDEGSSRHTALSAVVSESRRRTYWAVFFVERLLSDGKERPVVLRATNSVRMPGNDLDFFIDQKSPGAKFQIHSEPWTISARFSDSRRIEPLPDLFGYLLRASELWSRVAGHISGLDRRAPWLIESGFAVLQRDLKGFEDSLPIDIKFSFDNLLKHSIAGRGKTFGLLHILLSCATLVLHRHYLPFSPPKDFNAANGPIDGEPMYGLTIEPLNWWIDCLAKAVEASISITDICMRLISFSNPLTHPFVGYAVLAAGTLHLHLKFWPESYRGFGFDSEVYINQDFSLLSSLIAIYPIANVWCEGLQKLHSHYHRLKSGESGDFGEAIRLRASVVKLLTVKEEDGSVSPELIGGGLPSNDSSQYESQQNNPFDQFPSPSHTSPSNNTFDMGDGIDGVDLNFNSDATWPNFQFMASPPTGFGSSPPAPVMW